MTLPKKFTKLANFELAFDRVVRGQNKDYKTLTRHLFPSYQVSRRENLQSLIDDVRSGRYQPSNAITVYRPKRSGVLRPLRILTLQDQILYQAIANLIADAFRHDQTKNALTRTFGAILTGTSSRFFYKGWKNCYREYGNAIKRAFNRGNTFVADFDLVSFYELIDHTLLRKVLAQRVKFPQLLNLLFNCLTKWAENDHGRQLGHGIPQGPEASAFLAECFLFRFDSMKFKEAIYLRYVDDIKLMAKDETPVRRALLRMDLASKNVGLVPQAQKIECRKVSNVAELRKSVPSNVLSINGRQRVSRASQKRLERVFRSSIAKTDGEWSIIDSTKFKFALFRMNPTRRVLRRIGQLMAHYPDLSWVFASYLMKFPADREAADLILATLRKDPTYDSSAANYIEAMDVCEPSTLATPYRRVIQTAQRRSEEKSILLEIAATAFRARRVGPRDAGKLIEKQKDPLVRSILIHRLFGDDLRAPFKWTDARKLIENETKSSDADSARHAAVTLLDVWPWTPTTWKPDRNVHDSVKVLLKSLGLRKRGPNKIGVLDRFFKESLKIGVSISWRKALKRDWRDAEKRCLRLQELEVGDPSAWLCILDTFNEVLIQNFSLCHPAVKVAFVKATPPGSAFPNYGAWLNHKNLDGVIPKMKQWALKVHNARVKADLAHAKSRAGERTQSVSHLQRDKLLVDAQISWAELIRVWKANL